MKTEPAIDMALQLAVIWGEFIPRYHVQIVTKGSIKILELERQREKGQGKE